jgi:hypothetical protein
MDMLGVNGLSVGELMRSAMQGRDAGSRESVDERGRSLAQLQSEEGTSPSATET